MQNAKLATAFGNDGLEPLHYLFCVLTFENLNYADFIQWAVLF